MHIDLRPHFPRALIAGMLLAFILAPAAAAQESIRVSTEPAELHYYPYVDSFTWGPALWAEAKNPDNEEGYFYRVVLVQIEESERLYVETIRLGYEGIEREIAGIKKISFYDLLSKSSVPLNFKDLRAAEWSSPLLRYPSRMESH